MAQALPITEQRNPATRELDTVDTLQLVQLMNDEDQKVALAVAAVLPQVAAAIDQISARMARGGRLFYIGAGTSGRLGVLDASECPPTFNIAPDRVVGIIAGGERAIRHPVEEIEDRPDQGADDLASYQLKALDSVVGLAASGRTPYVIGAMSWARQQSALTVGIACVPASPLSEQVEISIAPVVGPEAVSGSTRLKAGTAQKMVLNMISTGVMVRLGKVYSNLMVDLRTTNNKLRQRAVRILQEVCQVGEAEAAQALQTCQGEVKTAIVMLTRHISADEAREKLNQADGFIRRALDRG